MSVIQSIFDWVKNNWIGTIIAIIISLAIGYLFYLLSNRSLKKYFSKVNINKLNQAKQKIEDTLEREFVEGTDSTVTPTRIKTLINSIAKKEEIDSNLFPSPIEILESITLRFRDSRQLNASQKEQYVRKIEKVIEETKDHQARMEEQEFLETNVGKLIKNIESILEKDRIVAEDKKFAKNTIILLKKRLGIEEVERTDYFIQITSFIMGILGAFVAYLIGSDLLKLKSVSFTNLVFMIILIIAAAIPLIAFPFRAFLRNK